MTFIVESIIRDILACDIFKLNLMTINKRLQNSNCKKYILID